MKFYYVTVLFTAMLSIYGSCASAETVLRQVNQKMFTPFNANEKTTEYLQQNSQGLYSQNNDQSLEQAVWPFDKNNNATTPQFQRKSTRKAFFLSFLFPGLGEAYVGSKRSLIFLGVEALAWYVYITKTQKGEDIEDDFQNFANQYWSYDDVEDSQGNVLDFNYWKWLQAHFEEAGFSADIDPHNHALVDSLLEKTINTTDSRIEGLAIHDLPSSKTQQYYEMIGKYDQFIYGWEDIDDPDIPEPNINIRDSTGIKYFGKEDITHIKSPMRNKYEDMRDDSNKELKAGQNGLYLMIINRIISAVDAARLAYHHNKNIDSELSMVRVQFVQKHIIDNKVPMIMVSKKF